MLTIFRRHTRSCPHTSRTYRRCSCPISVEGTLAGETIRKSLDLTSWAAAQNVVREWESRGGIGSSEAVPTIREAVEKFLTDAKARALRAPTIQLLRTVVEKSFLAWCDEQGFQRLSQLGVEQLRDYRATWTFAPVTAVKKLERLGTFFRFCHDSGWIERNPSKLVGKPRVPPNPTMPFTEAEMAKILAACSRIRPKGVHSFDTPKRIRAFILLLRYSGLRRSDAISLHASRVADGKLFIYTQKTGTPVCVPLPEHVIQAMELVRRGDHYFWSGRGNLKSATSSWDRTIRKVMKLAGVEGHMHMFRDTFAVSLLEKGVPLEDVSILLGHSSVKITEKHYAPWVRSRQIRLEERVRSTW